ncbi:hypothetical protein M9H77_29633 [Catharanthus roseus]|uniref:Uncharacterized protein n=1 Tax=Catharanthus roseus TaxID=4058 RepID=A0ACB9ZVW4_CATRO|nr:hypothetical protein M9H77_29633 [Catharanthus roseus]
MDVEVMQLLFSEKPSVGALICGDESTEKEKLCSTVGRKRSHDLLQEIAHRARVSYFTHRRSRHSPRAMGKDVDRSPWNYIIFFDSVLPVRSISQPMRYESFTSKEKEKKGLGVELKAKLRPQTAPELVSRVASLKPEFVVLILDSTCNPSIYVLSKFYLID